MFQLLLPFISQPNLQCSGTFSLSSYDVIRFGEAVKCIQNNSVFARIFRNSCLVRVRASVYLRVAVCLRTPLYKPSGLNHSTHLLCLRHQHTAANVYCWVRTWRLFLALWLRGFKLRALNVEVLEHFQV